MAKKKGPKNTIAQWEDFTQDLGWVDPAFLRVVIEHVGIYVYDIETCGAGKAALDPRKGRLDGIAFFVPDGTPKDFGSLGYYDGKSMRVWYPFNDFSFMCHVRVRDIPGLESKLTPIGVNMEEIFTTAKNKDGTPRKPDELILVSLRPPMDQEETMEALRPIWEELTDVIGIAHNGKFDSGFMLIAPGTVTPIHINNIWADSMLADFCTDERRRRYGLKPRTKQEFNHDMTPYTEAVRGQSLLAFCNAKPLGVYAMDDCYWTYRLHQRSIQNLCEQEPAPKNRTELKWSIEKRFGRVMGRLEKIYWGIDTRISQIIMEMEQSGVLIDWQWLKKVDADIVAQKDAIWKRMEGFVGWPLNPNSVKHVADALFAPPPDGLGLPEKGIPIGKTGDPSTADKVIKHFSRFHPLVADILKWRSLDTIQGGFVRKLIRLACESPDGRVYAHFNMTRTVIARLCVAAGTPIEVERDVSKYPKGIPIEDVKPGDLAYTYDDNLNLALRCVKNVWKTGHRQVYRLHWKGGNGQNRQGHLDVTPEHPIRLTDGSYVRADALEPGDRVMALSRGVSQDGYARPYATDHTIVKIEPLPDTTDVYDLEIEGTHNFIANEICVHNSSSDPINFQNQPRDKNLVRKSYCAHREGIETDDPDMFLLGGDFGQIELRVAAHLSQDANMLEVYRMGGICIAEAGDACERYKLWVCEYSDDNGECGHKWTPVLWTAPNQSLPCPKCGNKKTEHQARCRHVDLHQRTADDARVKRNPLAKNLNFGLLFRMGAPKFCVYAELFDSDGMPMVEFAKEIILRWHAAYPAIALFHEATEFNLQRNGWIAKTLFGRRRRLDQEARINRFRAVTQGVQFQVSGTAQDIMKTGMIRVWDAREKKIANARPAEKKLWKRFKFLMQIHDEVVMLCHKDIGQDATCLVKEAMEGVGKGYLRLPLTFETKMGRNWDEIH